MPELAANSNVTISVTQPITLATDGPDTIRVEAGGDAQPATDTPT